MRLRSHRGAEAPSSLERLMTLDGWQAERGGGGGGEVWSEHGSLWWICTAKFRRQTVNFCDSDIVMHAYDNSGQEEVSASTLSVMREVALTLTSDPQDLAMRALCRTVPSTVVPK